MEKYTAVLLLQQPLSWNFRIYACFQFILQQTTGKLIPQLDSAQTKPSDQEKIDSSFNVAEEDV